MSPALNSWAVRRLPLTCDRFRAKLASVYQAAFIWHALY